MIRATSFVCFLSLITGCSIAHSGSSVVYTDPAPGHELTLGLIESLPFPEAMESEAYNEPLAGTWEVTLLGSPTLRDCKTACAVGANRLLLVSSSHRCVVVELKNVEINVADFDSTDEVKAVAAGLDQIVIVTHDRHAGWFLRCFDHSLAEQYQCELGRFPARAIGIVGPHVVVAQESILRSFDSRGLEVGRIDLTEPIEALCGNQLDVLYALTDGGTVLKVNYENGRFETKQLAQVKGAVALGCHPEGVLIASETSLSLRSLDGELRSSVRCRIQRGASIVAAGDGEFAWVLSTGTTLAQPVRNEARAVRLELPLGKANYLQPVAGRTLVITGDPLAYVCEWVAR